MTGTAFNGRKDAGPDGIGDPTRRRMLSVVTGAVLGAAVAGRATDAEAQSEGFVDTTTDQSIGGVKTFTQAPVVPDDAFPQSAVTGLVADLASKQATIPPDTYLDTTTDQSIGGVKTFTQAPVVPDESFTVAKTSGLQAALDGKELTIAPGTYALTQTPGVAMSAVPGLVLETNLGVGPGVLALTTNAIGKNAGTGLGALLANTSGVNNTAQGYNALNVNTAGSNNTAQGQSALASCTSGVANTAQGSAALLALTTGNGNTAAGDACLQSITTADFNSCFGNEGMIHATGANNSGLGYAVLSVIAGNSNVGIGYFAASDATTMASSVAVGSDALYQPGGVLGNATTSGTRQTAIGAQSGLHTATQNDDIVAIGYRALCGGTGAVAIGSGAISAGDYGLAIGKGTSAGLAGSVVIGTDSAGTAARTGTQDAFVLGTALHQVTVPGTLSVTGTLTVGDAATLRAANFVTTAVIDKATKTGPYLSVTAAGMVAINRTNAGFIPLTCQGMAGQLSALQQWQSNTGVVGCAVDKVGRFITKTATAPVLGDLANGDLALSVSGTGQPVFTGRIGGSLRRVDLSPQAPQADTTGATLVDLETEVNGLKAKLRSIGLMA